MEENPMLFDKIRKSLNLAVGERFKIDDMICYFDEERFHADTTYIDKEAYLFFSLMLGRKHICQQKRMPNEKERYYYYEKGDLLLNDEWYATEKDLARYILGNCFLDEEEAKAKTGVLDMLLAKAKEIEKKNQW